MLVEHRPVISCEEEDDVFLKENLPYSDLNRWIPDNSIYSETFRLLGLARLHHIKSLSYVTYIGSRPEESLYIPYTHTRLDHTMVVAMVMEDILRNNCFPEKDVDTGIVAALAKPIPKRL
ncbi:MAG: hypothetical protein A2857_03990 [Candidatus Levybacteria bacterium RIFCSPHIGHO2_01_FULL_36_15]|nr:MAG: hypothetical protein A2857_03990 [Candidatus Levybacteria bacterium RIFCSPHIGHO2_01_FULL_36_15]OGH39174.1 MAG: hypothetical protein A2905_03080 [Candidatus Levybacteria bacterium RIFCSPLOWO2_01_FULL_36_10]